MKMLSIVEHMAFGREQAPLAIAQQIKQPENTDEHDSALNDMIREQLKMAKPDLMNEVEDELSR